MSKLDAAVMRIEYLMSNERELGRLREQNRKLKEENETLRRFFERLVEKHKVLKTVLKKLVEMT